MDERNDGLLRDPGESRVDQTLALADAAWDTDTMLDLHMALLDRAEHVRAAAMSALLEIARRSRAPAAVSPVALVERYMCVFTVASGVRPQVFDSLVQLGTPDAFGLVKKLLSNQHIRNEDFRHYVESVVKSGNADLISHLKGIQCSGQKAKISSAVLREAY